jgi:hypothetical protein
LKINNIGIPMGPKPIGTPDDLEKAITEIDQSAIKRVMP